MSGTWYVVDGRVQRLGRDYASALERSRELRAEGRSVRMAKTPAAVVRRSVLASQHTRSRKAGQR